MYHSVTVLAFVHSFVLALKPGKKNNKFCNPDQLAGLLDVHRSQNHHYIAKRPYHCHRVDIHPRHTDRAGRDGSAVCTSGIGLFLDAGAIIRDILDTVLTAGVALLGGYPLNQLANGDAGV